MLYIYYEVSSLNVSGLRYKRSCICFWTHLVDEYSTVSLMKKILFIWRENCICFGGGGGGGLIIFHVVNPWIHTGIEMFYEFLVFHNIFDPGLHFAAGMRANNVATPHPTMCPTDSAYSTYQYPLGVNFLVFLLSADHKRWTFSSSTDSSFSPCSRWFSMILAFLWL